MAWLLFCLAMIIPAPPFFFLFTLFFFPPFTPLSLSLKEEGRRVKGNFYRGGEEKGGHLLVIDLQTCQHQSCPLWEKAKREATQNPFPPPSFFFFYLLFPCKGEKERRRKKKGGGEMSPPTLFRSYHNRDWGSVFRCRTQTLEEEKKRLCFLRNGKRDAGLEKEGKKKKKKRK